MLMLIEGKAQAAIYNFLIVTWQSYGTAQLGCALQYNEKRKKKHYNMSRRKHLLCCCSRVNIRIDVMLPAN